MEDVLLSLSDVVSYRILAVLPACLLKNKSCSFTQLFLTNPNPVDIQIFASPLLRISFFKVYLSRGHTDHQLIQYSHIFSFYAMQKTISDAVALA